MCVFPGGGRGPPRLRPRGGLGRTVAGDLGCAARRRRGAGAGAGVRRGTRDVRGVRRPAGRGVGDLGGRGHDRRRLGGRPGRARGAGAGDDRLPGPAGAGAALGSAGRLGRVADAVFEPRRYRTWFFVADLPEGQRTRDVSSGVVEGDLVAGRGRGGAVDDGSMFMLPPTYLTCLEVSRFAAPSDVVAACAERMWTCSCRK